MSVTFVCDRCEAEMVGEDEYEAEVLWATHECEGHRDLFSMDQDLLRCVAVGGMSEAEAWIEQDARRN